MTPIKDITNLAQEVLGAYAATACLPELLIMTYAHRYPEGLVTVNVDNKLEGFFLIVPLTEGQASGLKHGHLKSGFQIASAQESDPKYRPASFQDARAYYLMGIYARDGKSNLIRTAFNQLIEHMSQGTEIFAKGTTHKGKQWMARKGFKLVNKHSPIGLKTL